MANYELSETADNDLQRLYEFGVLNFGLPLADDYYDGLIARFAQIGDMPKLYPTAYDVRPGYRKSVFGVHTIYYLINRDKSVKIIRILGREDPHRAFQS